VSERIKLFQNEEKKKETEARRGRSKSDDYKGKNNLSGISKNASGTRGDAEVEGAGDAAGGEDPVVTMELLNFLVSGVPGLIQRVDSVIIVYFTFLKSKRFFLMDGVRS
jgi:hypothetical protein